jgi:SAM-dependent methyltransferase
MLLLLQKLSKFKTCGWENWLIHLIYLREMLRIFPLYLRGRLIDIGCGIKPLLPFTEEYVNEHLGVDHESTLHGFAGVDLVGTAYQIPVESSSFDCALCTAVLEHLAEPGLALQECHRVLKDGGIAIYSVPFIWHLHEEPRDFYRFSRYGITYLFENAGFEIVELKPLSGFWVTFGQLFVYNLYRLNRGPLRWLHLIDMLGCIIQVTALALDRCDKTEQWTWMYLVVARKISPKLQGANCFGPPLAKNRSII